MIGAMLISGASGAFSGLAHSSFYSSQGASAAQDKRLHRGNGSLKITRLGLGVDRTRLYKTADIECYSGQPKQLTSTPHP